MKIAFVFLVLSFNTWAHQYIQCSSTNTNTTDMAVISLSPIKNTLFLSSGVGNDDEIRVLKEISFSHENEESVFYKSENEITKEVISLPREIVGVQSDFFYVNLELTHFQSNQVIIQEFSCYSRLYNDE
jgi:hypothetical protein